MGFHRTPTFSLLDFFSIAKIRIRDCVFFYLKKNHDLLKDKKEPPNPQMQTVSIKTKLLVFPALADGFIWISQHCSWPGQVPGRGTFSAHSISSTYQVSLLTLQGRVLVSVPQGHRVSDCLAILQGTGASVLHPPAAQLHPGDLRPRQKVRRPRAAELPPVPCFLPAALQVTDTWPGCTGGQPRGPCVCQHSY